VTSKGFEAQEFRLASHAAGIASLEETGARAGSSDCTFKSIPLPFVNVLFRGIRGGCLDIGQSHMSNILAGEILVEQDFR